MMHTTVKHFQPKRDRRDTQSPNTFAIIGAVGLLLIIGLLFFWLGASKPTASVSDSSSGRNASVLVDPSMSDLGTIAMSRGIVERTFLVKNSGSDPLRITDLQTSCMCTSAQLEVLGEKSEIFGMAGHGGGHHGGAGAAPKSWSMDIPAAGEGTLHVFYDPNAHGPAGVGPIERSITFNTNDPAHSSVEIRIKGTVVP